MIMKYAKYEEGFCTEIVLNLIKNKRLNTGKTP